MKFKNCPRCGAVPSDKWVEGRKLKQYCSWCDWAGTPRTPEIKSIKTTRIVKVNQFPGYCYEVFDRYGHLLTYSRSYDTRQKAENELRREIQQGEKKENQAGPYTAVLWPAVVHVNGKVFKED